MRVPHGLAGAAARVEHDAVALQLLLVRDGLRLAQHVRGETRRRGGERRGVPVMRLRDHQDMGGRLGVDVTERDGRVRLPHDRRRDGARDDLAEQTVVLGFPCHTPSSARRSSLPRHATDPAAGRRPPPVPSGPRRHPHRARSRQPRRRLRRGRLQRLQRQPHRLVELDVAAGRVVLGALDDLDVRVDAVVLDVPAVALQPEGVLGLGDERAVDQPVAAVDADDAAPGAGADDGADAERLDRRVDDVAVGAGELVGDGDDGSLGASRG